MKSDPFDWRSHLPRIVLILCALALAFVAIWSLHVHGVADKAAIVVSFLGGSMLLTTSTFHPLYLLLCSLAAGACRLLGCDWEFALLVAVIVTAATLWLIVPRFARLGSIVSYQRKNDSRSR